MFLKRHNRPSLPQLRVIHGEHLQQYTALTTARASATPDKAFNLIDAFIRKELSRLKWVLILGNIELSLIHSSILFSALNWAIELHKRPGCNEKAALTEKTIADLEEC